MNFDTENYSAYVFYMKETKSNLFDIGVYLFLAVGVPVCNRTVGG